MGKTKGQKSRINMVGLRKRKRNLAKNGLGSVVQQRKWRFGKTSLVPHSFEPWGRSKENR